MRGMCAMSVPMESEGMGNGRRGGGGIGVDLSSGVRSDWSCGGQSNIDKQQSLGRALIDSCYFGEALARLPMTLTGEP